ncbi:MAG: hypothetical protein CMJ28_03610 [Phycisphaerae bacterium]|nr:hypothetical protein [Phycisphaerae bacterium]
MTTLHYRGQAYISQPNSVVKPCVQLTYRQQHYITSRQIVRAEMQEHPTLVYRGVSYVK